MLAATYTLMVLTGVVLVAALVILLTTGGDDNLR
jgi:hypothetical protein